MGAGSLVHQVCTKGFCAFVATAVLSITVARMISFFILLLNNLGNVFDGKITKKNKSGLLYLYPVFFNLYQSFSLLLKKACV
jgi:hypothetical protein